MNCGITKPNAIYVIRCTVNGKVYVGRTQNFEKRKIDHLKSLSGGRKTQDFQQDYDKYGKDAFVFNIIEDDVSPERAKEAEAFWIREYRATDREYGYNKHSEQTTKDMNLKRLREQAGLRQEDLAKKLDVDQTAVSNWERGKCRPHRKYHKKLAKMLSCTVDELMAESKEA